MSETDGLIIRVVNIMTGGTQNFMNDQVSKEPLIYPTSHIINFDTVSINNVDYIVTTSVDSTVCLYTTDLKLLIRYIVPFQCSCSYIYQDVYL